MVESVDDAEGLSVAVERCPLCSTSRRRLTCARCVQAGDFVYFSGRNSERLEVSSFATLFSDIISDLIFTPDSKEDYRRQYNLILFLQLLHCQRC